jgi:hypothetical protein
MEPLLIALAVALLLFALAAGVDISHTLTLSWARNGETISQTVTVEAEGERNYNVTVNASTTDKQVECPIDVSEVKSLYIHSDQTVTVEFNDNAGAQGSFTVTANKPVIYYVGCGWDLSDLLPADVTNFYITNAGGTAAAVKIRILEDTTP